MIFTWYGLSCFKIETQDTGIAVNPFSKNEAMGIARAPRFKANILLVSQQAPEYNNTSGIDGNPFVMSNPGEYEIANIFFYGIAVSGRNGTVPTAFVIRSEDMTIAYLGGMRDTKLSEDAMRKLEDVDVMLVPVGGDDVCTANQAAKLVAQLEPSIVIPIHYKTSGMKGKLDTIDPFTKELNVKLEHEEKLSIRKRDIPEDAPMRLNVLSAQGIIKD